MRAWLVANPGRTLVVAGVLTTMVVVAYVVGVYVLNIGQSSSYQAESAALSTATTTRSSSSTTALPAGRTGSFTMTSSAGDKILFRVTISDPTPADQSPVGAQIQSSCGGLGGNSVARTAVAKVTFSYTVQSSMSADLLVSFTPANYNLSVGAWYLADFRDGWKCKNNQTSIGFSAEPKPGATASHEGWWVFPGAVSPSDPNGSQASLEIDTTVRLGDGTGGITGVSGDAFQDCVGIYMVLVWANETGCPPQ